MLIAVFLIFGLKKGGELVWRQSFGLEARKVTVQDSVSALALKGSGFPSPRRAASHRTRQARTARV